jgi:tetratricopeptide (TPR) repeat protein
MTPLEIERLDLQLSTALDHYYAEEHQLALPYFIDLARKAPTNDILFWLGNSAANVESWDTAASAYGRMLAMEPSLQRVRLELGMVYFRQGKYTEAREAFETVLASDPPPTVRGNIERMMRVIDTRTQRWFGALHLSQGYHWDSNVSTGPSSTRIDAPAGGYFTLGRTQREVDDGVSLTRVGGSLRYDPADRGGFMWNTSGSLYHTAHFTYGEFDFSSWQLATGPWWQAGALTLKLPAHYTREYYDHAPLDITYGVLPSLNYRFSPQLSLNGGAGWIQTDYDEDIRRRQDKESITTWLNPLLSINTNRTLLSLHLLYEDCNAVGERYSYEGYEGALGVNQKAIWETDLNLRYKIALREYEDPALGWLEDRSDTRHDVYASLGRKVWGPISSAVYAQWIDNQSNSSMYDYKKQIYGMRISITY